jgi:hypothetical protein
VPEVERREAEMKETVIRAEVAIGDQVYSVIRDIVATKHERYTIDETFVTDVWIPICLYPNMSFIYRMKMS